MAISNYTELNTAVANWLDRDDLTDRIPEFIALAEARFNRLLRIRAMEEKQTYQRQITVEPFLHLEP